jgi:hypothetical protein
MGFEFDWMSYFDSILLVGSIDQGIDVPGGGRKRAGTVILITFDTNALEHCARLRVSTTANLMRASFRFRMASASGLLLCKNN